VAPIFHGGAPDEGESLLDFSVNANPLGPSRPALQAARQASFARYPEPHAATLRAAIARALHLDARQVIVGNGSIEILWLLSHAFLERGDPALVVGPTFGEYRRAAALMGCRIHEVLADPAQAFRPDMAAICDRARRLRPRITFVCNPNNPTGAYLDASAIDALLAATPGLLVLDEAYVDFVLGAWDVRPFLRNERLVVIRSLTKVAALPGLRLGYGLASEAVVRALTAAQPPWSVNAAAQAAGHVILSEQGHVIRGRALAERAKRCLLPAIGRLGFSTVQTRSNFFLMGTDDAALLTARLRSEGIYVRDCTSLGLPRHVRIAARPIAECKQLVAALRRVRDGSDTRASGSGQVCA
jgi:histidinol-phosphate aminotransferase